MASLVSYGMCQTACNVGAVTCYAAAGATFGVTAGAGAPAVILACNSAQGACMAACAAKFLAEGSAETAASGGVLGPVVAVGGALLTGLALAGGAAAVGGTATAGGAAAVSGAAAGAAAAGGAATAAGTAAASGTAAVAGAAGGGAAGGVAGAGGVAVASGAGAGGAVATTGMVATRLLLGTSAIGIALTVGYLSYYAWDRRRANAGAAGASGGEEAPDNGNKDGVARLPVGPGVPGTQGVDAVPVAGVTGVSHGPIHLGPIRQDRAGAGDASSGTMSSSDSLSIPIGGNARGDAAIARGGGIDSSQTVQAGDSRTAVGHDSCAEFTDDVKTPEFPTDIQVVAIDRGDNDDVGKGRVVNIQQGRILVDFGHGNAPQLQLVNPMDVRVLPNDFTVINNSSA